MTSQHNIHDIRRLAYKTVKSMIEKTGGSTKKPISFLDSYKEVCNREVGINDKFDNSNEEMQKAVKDNMIRKRFIEKVYPSSEDFFYVTRHGIDEYNSLPEEKW